MNESGQFNHFRQQNHYMLINSDVVPHSRCVNEPIPQPKCNRGGDFGFDFFYARLSVSQW